MTVVNFKTRVAHISRPTSYILYFVIFRQRDDQLKSHLNRVLTP
jgi:hypothetical protein